MTQPLSPEDRARVEIDKQLAAYGWQVQSRERHRQNLFAQGGAAVREFPLKRGYADYLLCVAGKAISAVEVKKRSPGDQALRLEDRQPGRPGQGPVCHCGRA